MRRVIIYILVSIICGACSQTAEEIDTAVQKIVFGVEVSAPEARTALVNENGKYKAIWKAGDTFSVVQIADNNSALYSGTVAEDAASIVVNAEFEQSTATKFTYIFASPAATVSADCSYLEMSLPEEQSPAAMNTFDSTSDLILSNAVERESQPNGESVPFIAERISAVGKMTVKNLPLAEGEQVTSVTFTTTQPLAGSISNIKVSDIVAGNDALLNATYLNPKGTITINLPEPQSGEFTLYFSCLPATLPAGSEYSVTVTSTNSTYAKQAQIPSNLSFTAGRMTSFAVNMTDNSQEIASNNKILYTSSDGKIVTPYATDVFGATIVSNTYNNGQGVITFDSDVVTVGEYAFFNCGTLDSITLPEGLCEIKQFAFGSCSALKSINIPENVIIIEGGAFLNNSIEQFSGKFASEDGLTLVMEKTLVAYALGNTAEHYTIPQSIAVIGRSAFNGSLYLTGVTIPNGVVTLEDYAFCNCSKLAQVALPDSVTAIGEDAFFGCDKLVNISLGNGLTTIGYQAFVDCHSLRTVTLPASLTQISAGIFVDCNALETVYSLATTPPKAEYTNSASWTAFGKDNAQLKIYVPAASVEAYKAADGWKEYADVILADADPANCQILYTSTDGNVVTPNNADVFGATIVSNTYENGQGVITFDGEVTKIGYMAFCECRTLASITIPQSVTSIGRYAFHCTALTTITLPESVTAIDRNPFIGCANLAEFKGKFATSDGRSLIVDNSLHAIAPAGIIEYAVPENVTAICDDVFNACGNITSVTIPDSVISIGNYAFYGCGQLANIEIGNGVTTIGADAFSSCVSLTNITIPSSVTSIGEIAFGSCSSLASVYCKPTTPPTGGSAMFENNAADRKIYVPAASVEAYKTAAGWSDYADAIVAEGEDEIQSGDGILPTFESNEIVGNNVPFAVGDKFYVFNKINNCDEYKYNGNTNEGGKPIIELSNPTYYSSHEEIDKVIIVYNSESLQSSSLPVNEGSATSVNAVVKSVQDYVRGSYDIHAAPMISVSDDLGSVLLKNVCGWVKVSLTGNGETVKKIEFSGNNNENLATSTMSHSAATVSLADLSITNIGYAYNKLTMRFGENSDDVATLSSTPTDFYFSMLPTEFTNGFNMKITCTDGTMMTYTTNNSISVSRNEVYQETPFAYAGEQIKISLSDLNSPVFRDLTYTEGYANTFEVKVANNKYQNGFFIFYNPDYQPSGAGDAGTLNGEYEIVTDEIGTKTYTAKTFIADPSRSCVPYDGDLYYFKSGKVTVSGNNASTTIAFDAIVTNSEGGELPLKSQCTLESMGYTTLTNAKNLGFSSFAYQASGGYFTMQSTSGQNTMTIELKTTAKTPNELKDKTFTDTALTDYISSGSLQMGDLTSYDTLVGSITFAVEGLNYTMTTKGLKFVDGAGNIYQIPDGGYSVSLTQGTINSGGGIW